MTIVSPPPPAGTPTATFPYRLKPYNNITPFTTRDGETYIDELEKLKEWLIKYVVPYVDDTINAYVVAFNGALDQVVAEFDNVKEYVDAATATIDTKTAAFDSDYTAKTAAFDADYTAKLASFDAAAAAAQTSLGALVTAAQTSAANAHTSEVNAANWASAAYAMQDSNISAIINDKTPSQTRTTLTTFVNGLIAAFFIAAGMPLYLKSFGAKFDGVTDDTAVWNSVIGALGAGGGHVVAPAGVSIVSGEIPINVGNVVIEGAGRNTTIVRNKSTTANTFTVNANGAFTQIKHMTIDRPETVTPVSGANGIEFKGVNSGSFSRIEDVYVRRHWVGIFLRSATWSWVKDAVCQDNYSHGLMIQNDTAAACQWQLTNVLSQGNNGAGFQVQAINGTGSQGLILGQWTDCATFANKTYGMVFAGSSTTPVQDIRITNAFIGEDGNGGIYMDTYGISHLLTGVFTEIAGGAATGVNLGTPATGNGHGITITANNQDVTITGGNDNANMECGIYTAAANTIISGRAIRNNGQGSQAPSSSNSGVYHAGGNLTMTGCGVAGQQYAVTRGVDAAIIALNTFEASAINSLAGTANSILAPNRTA